jgi:hypothetical protein
MITGVMEAIKKVIFYLISESIKSENKTSIIKKSEPKNRIKKACLLVKIPALNNLINTKSKWGIRSIQTRAAFSDIT